MLYHIQKAYQEIELALAESGGEMTADVENMLLRVCELREDHLHNMACMIKNAMAEIKVYKDEENRLKSYRGQVERRIATLESAIAAVLPNDQVWAKGVHKLAFKESKAVEVVDADQVPSDYMRVKTTREVDKSKAGEFFRSAHESEQDAAIPGLTYVTRYNLQVK